MILRRFIMRKLFHRLIVWYLRRCGGAFHTFPYGKQGRYLVLLDEDEYNSFRFLELLRKKKEIVS